MSDEILTQDQLEAMLGGGVEPAKMWKKSELIALINQVLDAREDTEIIEEVFQPPPKRGNGHK